MYELSITLQPEQEAALRREYDSFCGLLANTVAAAPAPSFERYIVAKLAGNTGAIADELARSIVTSGSYRYLDRWIKGRFSSFVMTMLHMLRPAGYGFIRGRDTSEEELAKGTEWFLDALETELGTPIPPESRQELLEQMPQAAHRVDTLFYNESNIRFFDMAHQYLQECHTQFLQTFEECHLNKAERLLDFLSALPEWQAHQSGHWQQYFHEARKSFDGWRECRMTWVDRLLKRVVDIREVGLSQ